ncbi:aspartate/glutamate racemase family protein [Schumannella soli]|uniref:Hydantoin racemase n=1 Tax=Schumannella soli TaxID=2590779 RepID=A0A506XZU2_9MICO|nr:aspartate/glutamate racemase family protein [Schumannella soli]TPW74238.1 hypothetical protein FJ657_16605 [Schumannella soli]
MIAERPPVITWIEATPGDPALAGTWTMLAEEVEKLARGRAVTRLRHVAIGAGGIRTAPNRLMSDAAILAAALESDDDSDAMVIGCWGAPTEVVRAAVASPLTSLPDGSVRAVASLARRAVLVTVSPTLVPLFADDLRRLGASGFLETAPVRACDPESTPGDVLEAVTDPEALIARFDAVAQGAVRDGADAIVVGCGYLAPIFTRHGYTHVAGHPDVPVLDCNRLAFEHALLLLELARAGIAPTPRGYVRPRGDRDVALRAAAASLTSARKDHP